ncbi:hypothetical protein PG996_006851 [Apiospora saccharicola]|uniref:Uncharacterized protein n=1 Tax=Apiospora saccharicola TaxID=335842 RepID=A0ABR1V952_9PEZI
MEETALQNISPTARPSPKSRRPLRHYRDHEPPSSSLSKGGGNNPAFYWPPLFATALVAGNPGLRGADLVLRGVVGRRRRVGLGRFRGGGLGRRGWDLGRRAGALGWRAGWRAGALGWRAGWRAGAPGRRVDHLSLALVQDGLDVPALLSVIHEHTFVLVVVIVVASLFDVASGLNLVAVVPGHHFAVNDIAPMGGALLAAESRGVRSRELLPGSDLASRVAALPGSDNAARVLALVQGKPVDGICVVNVVASLFDVVPGHHFAANEIAPMMGTLLVRGLPAESRGVHSREPRLGARVMILPGRDNVARRFALVDDKLVDGVYVARSGRGLMGKIRESVPGMGAAMAAGARAPMASKAMMAWRLEGAMVGEECLVAATQKAGLYCVAKWFVEWTVSSR